MLVYATHTGTRDITERMEQFLSQHGFKVAVRYLQKVCKQSGGVPSL